MRARTDIGKEARVAKRGYRSVKLDFKGQLVAVYASHKRADALQDMMNDMGLYEGVKFAQLLETVYVQGRKDGALEALDGLDRRIADLKKALPHRKPGRPRKRKKP